MHVTTFGVVLFLHITLVIVAFAMAGLVHVGMPMLARARTTQEMRPWVAILHRLDPFFPLVALLLLGLGSWLVHLGAHTDDQFSFKDGWILTAIVSLVVIEATAGALLAPAAKRLHARMESTPDGPVDDDLRCAVLDWRIWHVGHAATFGFLGIVFLMAAKPAGGWAPVVVGVGVAIGLVLSSLQLRAFATPADGSVTLPGQRDAADVPSRAAH
jgi:hypothetical protein